MPVWNKITILNHIYKMQVNKYGEKIFDCAGGCGKHFNPGDEAWSHEIKGRSGGRTEYWCDKCYRLLWRRADKLKDDDSEKISVEDLL